MRGKVKSSIKPKPNDNEKKFNFFTWLDKITDKFSFRHLDKIIDKSDTYSIIFLVVVLIIFIKIWDFTKNQNGNLFGIPYWFITIISFILILALSLIIYRRKPNQS